MNRESAVPTFRFFFRVAGTFGALVVVLLLVAGSAMAALGHPVVRTFSTGPGTAPRGVALDGAGDLYVAEANAQRVDKFSPTGTRIPFSATEGYVNEASLTGTTRGPFELVSWPTSIVSVDHSGGPNDGDIYVASYGFNGGGSIFVFGPSGNYLSRVDRTSSDQCTIAVNQTDGKLLLGHIYLENIQVYPRPTGLFEEMRPESTTPIPGCSMASDSTGDVWVGPRPYFTPGPAGKYSPSQFGTAAPKPLATAGTFPQALATDSADDLYTDEGSSLAKFDSEGHPIGQPFGSLVNSTGIAVASDGDVFAVDDNGGVFVYGPAEVNLPKATTGAASNVTKSSADVVGTVDPDGAGTITGCEVRYGEDSGYSTGSASCEPAAPITTAGAIKAHLSGLVSGVTYRYRVFVTNANGTQMATEEQALTTEGGAVEGVAAAPASGVAKDAARTERVLHRDRHRRELALRMGRDDGLRPRNRDRNRGARPPPRASARSRSPTCTPRPSTTTGSSSPPRTGPAVAPTKPSPPRPPSPASPAIPRRTSPTRPRSCTAPTMAIRTTRPNTSTNGARA